MRQQEAEKKSSKRFKDSDGESSDIILPGLPNEIALDCLAKVPRLMHQHLLAVSKVWKTVLSSQILNWNSSSKGLPKDYMYVNLMFSAIGDERFYAWNLENKTCLPLPMCPVNVTCAKFVVSRGRLFSIGGLVNSATSADVSAYDPSLNRWECLASLKLPRYEPAVASIGGKIYVMGGCGVDSSDWAEVYDPELGLWTSLSIPSLEFLNDGFCRDCAVVNGKLFGMCYGGLGFVFDPVLSTITTVSSSDPYERSPCNDIQVLFATWKKLTQKAAVVKGILFAYLEGKIRGYDFEHNRWLALQGTGKRLRSGLYKAFLVNVDEKLGVIRKNENEIVFACLDIHKLPGRLRCNVICCHSEVSSGRPWSVGSCVSLAE